MPVEGLPDWFLTAVVALIFAVAAYLNRERLGLGVAQVASREESDRLVELQEKRIAHLEKEIERLQDQVRWLSAENAEYRRRIARLEEERGVSDEPFPR